MLQLSNTYNDQFNQFVNSAIEQGTLSTRERAVACLLATLLLESNATVKPSVLRAKQAGLSNQEIGQVSAIAIALQGQKVAQIGTSQPQESSFTPRIAQSSCCQ